MKTESEKVFRTGGLNEEIIHDGWEFSKQPLHTTLEEMQAEQDAFVPIGLPHDWLIYDADNLYEDGTGWYRRKLTWKKKEGELFFCGLMEFTWTAVFLSMENSRLNGSMIQCF